MPRAALGWRDFSTRLQPTIDPQTMHVLLISNTAAAMVWFRVPLMKALVARGHTVSVLAPPGARQDEITATGASFIPLGYGQGWAPDQKGGGRSYTNPFVDLQTTNEIRRVCRELRPDLTLAYTHKMTVLGDLGASLARVPRVHGMITGLGYANLGGGWKQNLQRFVYHMSIRTAAVFSTSIIMLNPDNVEESKRRRLVAARKLFHLDGEGVDTEKFKSDPPTSGAGPTTFLCIARLVKYKGVADYVEAARLVRAEFPETRFMLVGQSDPNHPSAVPTSTLEAWRQEGLVELHDSIAPVQDAYREADVFVLASYGTEGLPMSIMEAMAMSRPIVTTRAPGNSETVVEGENGFIVEQGSVQDLAARMTEFLRHPESIPKMGQASRQICERRFSYEVVNRQLIDHLGL